MTTVPPGTSLDRLAKKSKAIVNPANLFAGCSLGDALVADNVVLFKRTSIEMFKPRGITHNYHHRFVLIIPFSKAGRIHVDGVNYLIEPGQAYVIFPYQFHHFLDINEPSIDWLFITFECKSTPRISTLRNSPRHFGEPERDCLERLLKHFISLRPGPDRNFGVVMDTSQLVRLLLDSREVDCIRKAGRGSEEGRNKILQEINAYVRSHLSEQVQIADIAKHTGYSGSYIRAVFRKEFGSSLGAYVRDSRLSVAAEMLSVPEHASIDSIAKDCGFESIYVFSRTFKKATGLSPRAYSSFVAQ